MTTSARSTNHDDERAPDDLQRHASPTLPAIQQPDLLTHIFAHINDVPTLFRASHVCRSWHTAAQTPSLWTRLYRRLNRRCPAPLLHQEADGTALRGYLLESALRDQHAWSGLKRLGTRLKHANGQVDDDVSVEDLHVVHKYTRIGTVVAQCPHLLGEPAEGGEELMKVTGTAVVFEPRLVGNLRSLRTRTFVQVQPLIDPGKATPSTPTPPPALLLSCSRERVETFAENGTIKTINDTHFRSAASSSSRWAYTQTARRVHLYPLTSPRARITITPPVSRCQIICVSCSDDWLAITYRTPLLWIAEHANDDDNESNLPHLLAVYDLRAVRWPKLAGDRCLLLDPTEVGIPHISVWVPFAHNLVHTVSDATDPFPIVPDAANPWPSPVSPSPSLLKVVVVERGDARRAVTGHRLVVVTFDITTAAELVAWQPYRIVPQRTRDDDGAARDPCCDIAAWRLFGRILVGVPRDPACCPRVQFARDDSGVGTASAIDPGLKAVLTTSGRAAFDAVTVLLRPLLRALRRSNAHDAHTAANVDDDDDKLTPNEIAFICAQFPSTPDASQIAAWASHLLSTPLRIVATLPPHPVYRPTSMHFARRTRLIILSTPHPSTSTSDPPLARPTQRHAVTSPGHLITVLDVPQVRVILTTALPPTTTHHLPTTASPNPLWTDTPLDLPYWFQLMIPVDMTRAALLLPMRRVNDADALTDPAVLGPIRAATRPHKNAGGMVRRLYAPGTVLAAAAGNAGVVLVRSLGPLRGSVVEVCRYREKRHGGAGGVKVEVPKIGPPVWIRDTWPAFWPEKEERGEKVEEVEDKEVVGSRMQVKRQAKADGRRKRRGGRGGGAPGAAGAGARKSTGLVDEVDEARQMLADLDAWSDDAEDEEVPVEDEDFDEDAAVDGEYRPVGVKGDNM